MFIVAEAREWALGCKIEGEKYGLIFEEPVNENVVCELAGV
jgi:hypothetical protein